jgi:hypothetical protein
MERLAFKMLVGIKGTLEVRMAFEEDKQMACLEVVVQKATTGFKEVAETC